MFFLLIGIIIIIGFLGRVARQRTSVPESLFLIMFGIVMGPVLGIVPGKELLEFLPVVSVAAMIAILIESGIGFDISTIKGSVQKAVVFTFLVGLLTTVMIAAYLHYIFGWQIMHALLLGLISSGTTTITTMALLKPLDIKDNIKQLIFFETIINDFTLIVGTFMIVEVINVSSFSLQQGAVMVFSEFSVAVLIGIVASFIWKQVLSSIKHTKLGYASTLGVCFILYFLADFVNANPIISIFTFSLLLGNYHRIFRAVSIRDESDIRSNLRSIRAVQTDMTFFLATTFFVLLGLTFDVSILLEASPLILGGIVVIILLARFCSATILSYIDRSLSGYRALISIMIPRGYVAAVLAFVPAQEGIEIPMITDIIVVLIVITTLIAIVGTAIYARRKS